VGGVLHEAILEMMEPYIEANAIEEGISGAISSIEILPSLHPLLSPKKLDGIAISC